MTGTKLSTADEHDLWRRFKTAGCEQSRGDLYAHHAYLVPKTRHRIIPTVPVRIDAADLIQEGSLGLLRAVDQFDPARNVKFSGYAINLIRCAMLEYLRQEDWVPRSVRTKQKLLTAAETAVEARTGVGNAKPEQLAAELGLELEALWSLYREASVLTCISLAEAIPDPFRDDLDPLHVSDEIPDPGPLPDETALLTLRNEALWDAWTWLPAMERAVIEEYYVWDKTLVQFTGETGRCRSRGHQLHQQAKTRLAGFLGRQAGLFMGGAP